MRVGRVIQGLGRIPELSKFIVIEGLIGVGKTSLCRILQREWNVKLVLEPCEDNPFLASFYADRKRFAFPAQMFYLASRYAQQMGLKQGELFDDLIVSDYLYEKDRLFAEETLGGEELTLYSRFANLLRGSMTQPDFVVFLEAPTDVILSRIEKRGIVGEDNIDAHYLDSLRERYYDMWNGFDGSPVYVIPTTELNYTASAADRTFILNLIEGWLSGVPAPTAPSPYRNQWQSQPTLF